MKNNQKEMIRNMRRRGMPYGDIAAALGLSSNTVKSFCRRENISVTNDSDSKNRNLCKNCGAPLKHHPGSKKRTFCCDKCRYAWWNKNRLKGNYRLTCFYCGHEFYSNNKKQKYCGRECYIHSRCGEELP